MSADDWVLNNGDNAWQLTAAMIVGMQSVPGLVILYGSVVKKKWAINSTFMALYAFAVVLVMWALFAYDLSFNHNHFLIEGFWGRPEFLALGQQDLLGQWSPTGLPSATNVFF
ncbi:hypothetical protein SUGI_0110360 [Cryptomeria japonica]|nr:hypothetical protein SUGI_0110360 [Cryptomeria japonica]